MGDVKERPILFSGEMVRAILEGRKTQTRRVVKLSGTYACFDDDGWPMTQDICGDWNRDQCPYGQAGDRLWVRETWQAHSLDRQWWHEVKAEDRSCMNWAWTNPVKPAYDLAPPKWLPAIHMPRIACRITLEVVSVRVERVQDISDADAQAEGVEMACVNGSPIGWARSYKLLWNSINHKRGYGWDVNPWVWVVEFALAKKYLIPDPTGKFRFFERERG